MYDDIIQQYRLIARDVLGHDTSTYTNTLKPVHPSNKDIHI